MDEGFWIPSIVKVNVCAPINEITVELIETKSIVLETELIIKVGIFTMFVPFNFAQFGPLTY